MCRADGCVASGRALSRRTRRAKTKRAEQRKDDTLRDTMRLLELAEAQGIAPYADGLLTNITILKRGDHDSEVLRGLVSRLGALFDDC